MIYRHNPALIYHILVTRRYTSNIPRDIKSLPGYQVFSSQVRMRGKNFLL